jgi:hypothetical protein
MSEFVLTEEVIREAMLRAEKAARTPADQHCYGFPNDAKRRSPVAPLQADA